LPKGHFDCSNKFFILRDRRSRDRMVVGFTITCSIRAYHH